MRNLGNGRKFNKGADHEDAGEACCPNHGIGISGDALQHYGYSVDRLLGSKAVAESASGNVYLAFAGAGVHGENGRTGSGGTMYRARGPGKAHGFAIGCSAAFSGNGNRVCSPLSYICQSDGGIFLNLRDAEAQASALAYTKTSPVD